MKIFQDDQRSAIVKRLVLLLRAILTVFAAINAVWYFGYRQKYTRLSSHLDAKYIDGVEEKDMLRYSKEVDGYSITLKTPAYLGMGGFVAISRTGGYETQLDEEGNIVAGSDMLITLYIWPKFFSDYKLGLDFFDEFHSIWNQVEFTSDMEMMNTDTMDDEYIKNINNLMAEHQAEIEKMIQIARETLDIAIKGLEGNL